MPHIPRSMAPSGLVDPSTVPRAPRRTTKRKPDVPYMGSGKGESKPVAQKVTRKNPMIQRLSMRDWDVDPLRVMKLMMDKEVKADEHSGLVSTTK